MARKVPHLNSWQSHLTAGIVLIVVLPGVIIGSLRLRDRLQQDPSREPRISASEEGRDLHRWFQSWWPWSQNWFHYTSVGTEMELYDLQVSYDPDWRLRMWSQRILMIVPALETQTAGWLDVPIAAHTLAEAPSVQEDFDQSLGFILTGAALNNVLDQSLVVSSRQTTVQGRSTTTYRLDGRSELSGLPDWFARDIRIDVVHIATDTQLGFVFSDAIRDADAQRMVDSVRWSLDQR